MHLNRNLAEEIEMRIKNKTIKILLPLLEFIKNFSQSSLGSQVKLSRLQELYLSRLYSRLFVGFLAVEFMSILKLNNCLMH